MNEGTSNPLDAFTSAKKALADRRAVLVSQVEQAKAEIARIDEQLGKRKRAPRATTGEAVAVTDLAAAIKGAMEKAPKPTVPDGPK